MRLGETLTWIAVGFIALPLVLTVICMFGAAFGPALRMGVLQ